MAALASEPPRSFYRETPVKASGFLFSVFVCSCSLWTTNTIRLLWEQLQYVNLFQLYSFWTVCRHLCQVSVWTSEFEFNVSAKFFPKSFCVVWAVSFTLLFIPVQNSFCHILCFFLDSTRKWDTWQFYYFKTKRKSKQKNIYFPEHECNYQEPDLTTKLKWLKPLHFQHSFHKM